MVASDTNVSTSVDALAPGLRERVRALLDAAGGRLRLVSGRRSTAQQIELRRQHCGPSHYDIWEKPAGQCNPPTAKPGQSKHEQGLAADIGPDYGLLAQLGPQFGLAATVAGEPWHWELAEGTTVGPVQSLPGVSTIAGFGGDLAGSLVDPFIDGLRVLVITGAVLGAGALLVVLGGVRLTNLPTGPPVARKEP